VPSRRCSNEVCPNVGSSVKGFKCALFIPIAPPVVHTNMRNCGRDGRVSEVMRGACCVLRNGGRVPSLLYISPNR
jgi:hypothetical protein